MSKANKFWRIIGFIILGLVFLVGAFFILSDMWSDRSYRPPYNSRIISAISQARTVMTWLHSEKGHLDDFACEHKEMISLCEEIDNNYKETDGKVPFIIHDKLVNAQKACIYSPMNWRDNYWYCADNEREGRLGYTEGGFVEINPATEGYCVEGESADCPPFVEW